MPKNKGTLLLSRTHLLSASQRNLPPTVLAERLVKSINKERNSKVEPNTDLIIRLLISSKELAALSEMVHEISHRRKEVLSFLERENMIESLADWLEAHGELNGFELAVPLSEYPINTWDLESIYQMCGLKHLEVILRWFHYKLSLKSFAHQLKWMNPETLEQLVMAFNRVSFG